VWLLPIFSALSRACLRIYYQIEVDGPPPAATGPLLLVANHPNSLLDPACVVAFAERPVRFLAKAPLFEQKDIGWLVRAAGSIPVHRRQDDPSRIGENDQTFRAAEDALLDGAAVGIFPEGLTHDEPHLSALKTGGARIALGTALRLGTSFPIAPIGLSFPEKAIFRSTAFVVRGEPVAWNDLAGRPPADVESVRELTRRIDEALRTVTVNLERWEDEEVVAGAEAIFAAEGGLDPGHARRLERVRIAAEQLSKLRAEGSPVPLELGEAVRRHMMRLDRFRLTPADLVAISSDSNGGTLKIGVSGISGMAGWILASLGGVVFYPPYRFTGWIQNFLRPDRTAAATYKLLAGILIFLAWYFALVVGAAIAGGATTGIVVAILLPPLGLTTLWMRDRSAEALRRAQRGWVVQRRRAALLSMRRRQIAISERLGRILDGKPA
jgi:glycerol-3-phosphate O-acyltransferase / dihydroxyacetone phosphate acyltransferase